MTKSFEVSIAIMILLAFVFFVFEMYTLEYRAEEVPESARNLILNNAKDKDFRSLVENKDVDHIYQLLYNDIDQKFNIKICDKQEDDCVIKNTESKFKKNISYYFGELDKTLYVLFY